MKMAARNEITEKIAGGRSRAQSLFDEGNSLALLFDDEENSNIQEKICALESSAEDIAQVYNASLIDRTLGSAAAYLEAKDDLLPWLEDTQSKISSFDPPAILSKDLIMQQEEVDALREDVVEHRPYVDKLNKLGNQLAQLIVPDNPNLASDIVQSTDDINKSYASLREGVRTRSSVLKSALDESNQFFERMKAVMEKLAGMKNKLLVKEPTTIEADRIKECIGYIKDMEVQMEKILPTYNGLKMLAQQLLERSDEQSLQFTKSVVENQLKEMSSSWDELTELIADKTKLLLALLDSCLRFYKDADSLRTLLRELDTIIDDEVGEPAVDLVLIKQQIEVLETLCEEMDKLEKDLQSLHKEADDLCASTGLECPDDAPATMEVRSVMEELNDTWNHLQKNVTKTRSKLDEAMNSAIEYQESVQRMLDLVKEACESIDHLPAVATDLEAIKSQIDELNDWRTKTHSYQMEMERLCNQGEQLIARAKGQEEKVNLHNLINEMRESWKQLNGGILQRKHDLETALLALGQLHHAINELAAWIENTDKELDSHQIPSAENPKQIEIELAKHKILWNDIIAHKATLESLTAAAHDLNSSTSDRGVESKMNDMNSAWEEINAKAQARQWELEECLEMAHDHQQELDSLSRWLLSKENELSQNIPYGGLPETASQQLAEHMEKMEDLAKKKETAEKILANGTEKQHEAELMNKLHAVESKMAQKRSKLEEVLAQAESFHKDLQQFMEWLTQTEKALDANQPPSVILDTLTSHLESHKAFENDVHGHRDILLELDKSGSHLKYFSQKQDGILIKNLLLSVHSRWDKVTSRTSDRTHMLNDLHKKVCQYVDSWNDLNEWLDSALTDLSADFVPATDADKIKALIENHKEFQRAFAAKRQIYDATTRSAKFLRDKAHSYADKSHVDDKQRELKAKWDRLSAKSCERQNELEEALMVTGRLMDAIESMLDWLYVTEPSVAADAPVHGDLHTVINLIDQHRVLLSEIVTREGVIKSLEASSSETCDDPDSSWVKNQMQELLLRWEALCKFAKVKEARLGSAKAQAEEFQVSTQEILDWLSDAEKNLQLNQQLPEDEFQLQEMKATNNEFMADVESKKNEMERTMALGNSILEQAHPDAITPLKHWITTLQSRWDEVVTWAKQHETRLDNAIAEMEKNAEVTKKLIDWLKEGENTLDTRNAEALPPSVETLDKLIVEHQAFQDVMLSLQPEYDSVTRTTKRRPTRSDVLGRKRKSGDLLNEDDSPSSKLQSKWQRVWLKVLDRQQKLQNARDVAQQVANMESFSFDKWRSQYMKWMQNKKSRVMDFFRHIDTDGDGKITRQEFIDGILKSKFSTSEIEMQRVADIFDQDKDGYIDYYEFVAALHPNKESYKPATDADKIEDEVVRQVAKCTCCKRFQVQQISENKYRFFMGSQFGDNQQLRLVRILRSTVMVRVGGGWMALDEFLVKNDPCRVYGGKSNSLDSYQALLRRRMLSTPMTYKYTTRTSSMKKPLTKVDTVDSRRHEHPTTYVRTAARSTENLTDNSVIPDYDINQHIFSSANDVWTGFVESSLFHIEQNSSSLGTSGARVQEWLKTCEIENNSQKAEQQQLLNTNNSISAKGRTNTELREKFILPQGASQTMAAFRTKRSQTSKSSLQGSHTPSRGSSRGASPSRSATPQSERLSHTTPKSTSHNGNPRSGKSPASCSSSERSTASRVSAGDVKSPTARFGSSPMTSTPKTGTAQRQSKIPTKGTGGTRRKI